MRLPAMNMPATLYRARPCEQGRADSGGVVVAQGPFVILAHGLLSLPAADRGAMWIRCSIGDMMPADVEQVLGAWNGRPNA